MSADPNAIAETGEVKRKKRNTDGKKPLTFCYNDNGGVPQIGIHRTKAFSKSMAWKEYKDKHALGEDCVLTYTFAGQLEEAQEKFRKPTRTELLELAGLKDD